MNERDRVRFVHNLYAFNDTAPAGNTYKLFKPNNVNTKQNMDLVGPYFARKREQIVDIHGWCLMNNHYHLLVSERVDGGLTKFITKLNVGYAKYFNEKYKRSGTLFQSRTKKIPIERDAHFLHILHYIHLNPLDFVPGAREWRERRLTGASRALAHLNAYRWSSYLDYCGTRNFPSILTTDLFGEVFGNYKKTLDEYVRDLDIEQFGDMTLE